MANPYLQDSVGAVWLLRVSDAGLLQTVLSPGILNYVPSLSLNDVSVQQTWILTVLPNGTLHITQAGFTLASPSQISLQSTGLFVWNLQISNGLLQTTDVTGTTNTQTGGTVGTFNSSILPASDGLNLGSIDQKWDAFLQTLTIDGLQTASSSPSETGTFKLGSNETIGWRNNADDADILLSKDTSDIFSLPASIKFDAILSNSLNSIAQSGFLRLAASDLIAIRNNADTADIPMVSLGSDDSITIGGSSGVKVANLRSASLALAQSGFGRMGNGEGINWRNFSNTADQGLTLDTSDRMVLSSNNGLLLTGNNPFIYFGGLTTGFSLLKKSGSGLAIRTADDSSDAPLTVGNLTASALTFFSMAGLSNLAFNQTGLTANLSGALTIFGPGTYLLFYYVDVSQAATTSSSVTLKFQWASANGTTSFTSASPANTLADAKSGIVFISLTSGNIAITTTYASSGATPMKYGVSIKGILIA